MNNPVWAHRFELAGIEVADELLEFRVAGRLEGGWVRIALHWGRHSLYLFVALGTPYDRNRARGTSPKRVNLP